MNTNYDWIRVHTDARMHTDAYRCIHTLHKLLEASVRYPYLLYIYIILCNYPYVPYVHVPLYSTFRLTSPFLHSRTAAGTNMNKLEDSVVTSLLVNGVPTLPSNVM